MDKREIDMLLTLSSGSVSAPAMNAAEAIVRLARENAELDRENAYLLRRVRDEGERVDGLRV